MKSPALLTAALALAVAAPAAAEKPALRREVLDNGAVLLVKEDHNMPVVTLQAWFRVGSTTEGENLGQGLSHYVEHMIFKGTQKQKPGDYARAVRAAGGTLNAYTHFERTVFFCTVRSEYFDLTLDSFSDVIMNSTMTELEAKKEQLVIVNELKMYLDDPNRLIQYAFNETAMRVHPARHPIGGYLDQFMKLKATDVGEYFRKFYVPNNMIFIVVGDVDGAAAMSAIKKSFADFKRRPLPPVVLPVEPEQAGVRREQRTYAVTGEATSGGRLKMGWKGVDALHPDAPALDMASLVMGYGESSRLTRKLKYEKKLVQAISAHNDTPSYAGFFSVYANLDPANLEAVEKETLAEVERMKTEEVSEEELERVLAAVMTHRVTSRQTVDDQADSLGQNEMYYGNAEHDDVYFEKLKAVTAPQIQAAVRKYLVPDHLTVASVVPRRKTEEAAGTEVAKKSEFEPGIEEFKLDNGMRVIVRRNPNLPSFGMTIAFLAGTRFEPSDRPGLANLASESLLRGTKTRDARQLAAEINRTGGSLRVQGGKNALTVNAEMLKERLDTACTLMADILMNPAFDPREVDHIREAVVYQLNRMKNDAGSATSLRNMQSLYGDHPYARNPLGTIESVKSITPEELLKFHRRFVSPDNCVVAIAGDVTVAEVRSALEKAFAGFKPSGEALPVVPSVRALTAGVADDITDPSKKMGVAVLTFPAVDVRSEDRWPLAVLDSILGGMGARLWDEVRERRNLAYSVWASNVATHEPGFFQFGVMAQGANIDTAVAVIQEEIAKVIRGEILDEELIDAKNKSIGENLIALQKNQAQATAMCLDTLYGMGPGHLFQVPGKIEKVTLEDLKRVAKKYLDTDKRVLTITRPAE